MTKIYKRSTLYSAIQPKKKDDKNRIRNIIMNFRVSADEKEKIENRIALSGLHKSDFFIQSCMYQQIHTTGNVRTFDAIRKEMERIDCHLQRLQTVEELDEGILTQLRTILEILDSIYTEGG